MQAGEGEKGMHEDWLRFCSLWDGDLPFSLRWLRYCESERNSMRKMVHQTQIKAGGVRVIDARRMLALVSALRS